MLRTADAAAEIGSWAMCAVAAHDAVRYGASDAAACLVARAAARVQGRMLALLAEHADARAGQDASRLDQVSSEFETAGTSLLAAEAAYAAGAAHRRGGDRGLAAVSLARGIALHARGEGARIPWVTPPGTACSPRASSRSPCWLRPDVRMRRLPQSSGSPGVPSRRTSPTFTPSSASVLGITSPRRSERSPARQCRLRRRPAGDTYFRVGS